MSEKYKILHLVSEPKDVDLIFGLLQSAECNFEQLTVNDRENFVKALEETNPHLVLVNDGSSSFTLKDVQEDFKRSGYKVPFVVISENDSAEFAMTLIRNGADDYLLKNNLNELPDIILDKIQKRKGEENELKKTISRERKFRRIVESADNPLVVFTPDGKTSYISPAAEKLLGFSEADLSEIDITRIIHTEDVKPALHYMSRCLENPGVSLGTISARVKHKDKTWRWMEASFTNLLYDEDVRGIVNNFKEITAQREAEISLKKSEEKYRSFFENSMDAILLSNREGEILAANPAATEIFMYTEEELCKIGREGIIDNRDLGQVLEERNSTASFVGEITMKRKDGSRFPAEVSSGMFLDENDEAISSTIIRDISERKQIEEELRSSKKNYEHLFEFNPLPNWIYDLKTLKIVAVNRAAINHYGYSREEFLSMHLRDLRPQEEIPKLMEDFRNLDHKGSISNFGKFIHRKKDGSQITVEVHGYGIKFDKKECRLVTSIDVTEKENVMQKLEEKSNKLLWAEKLAKFGYWEIGLQDEHFFWSDEVYRIWGRKKEDFQVDIKVFLETIHPDDVNAFVEEQKAAISGSKDLDFQHRIILPDGSIKWVHEKGKLVKDNSGKPLRFEGSVQDVTDFNNAMLKLKQSEGRQRAILKSQTNYLTRMDLKGDYSYVNDKFASDFAWIFPDGEIVGKCSITTVKEYHREKVTSIFNKCISNPNTVYQVEMEKLQEDGKGKPTLWDFICLTDADGNPVEVQGVGIDITDRVEAEKSLQESNTRYELVSKATSDAIYDWDIETNHLYWGEAFYTLFGHSQDEFSPSLNSWSQNVHPEERQSIQENLARTIEGTENRWEAEYRFKKADGKYSFVVEKGFILRDENGKAFRMVGAIQDITEKKKLEELLDEASRFARIGSFEFDFEQGSLYWSPVTKEIHEVDKDFEPDYESGLQFYKEGESRDVMTRAFQKAVEENVPYDLELQMITAKGNERWVRKIGRPTFVDGKCVRINGSFQDITNLKNSELKAIEASEEKQVILESIGDAFFAVDQNWKITYFNKHAEKLLDCKKDEVIGKDLWEVFSDAIPTRFFTYYNKAVEENTIQDFEEYFERTGKWFDVTAYPSENGLSVYFRDVTQRKKSELQILELNKNLKVYTQELVESNKGLEQFSFIVSHNLRSPVANILGLAELIRSEEYPPEVKENFLNELFDNVQRLDNVITDLNDILQVRTEMDSRKEPVVLETLVDSIKSSIRNLIEKEDVQIITNFDVPQLQTVQSYLYSIFYNLIANSVKYRRTDVSPRIEISSEEKNGDVMITFEDNGLGIDMAKKGEQLFGLYKRFHHHVEGKGMGLFLVKTQVKLLGGSISVESEVNRGTRFTIMLKGAASNYILEDEENTSLRSS